jgi:hypothetical protein
MFPRVAQVLALVSVLTGCVGSPPRSPFVEYREGLPPAVRRVTCEATYTLYLADRPSAVITEHHITRGERIGFRREEDGSVAAVAPGQIILLPPGAYTWGVLPGSVPPWRERFLCEARQYSFATARVTGITLLAIGVAALAIGLFVLYAEAKTRTGNS